MSKEQTENEKKPQPDETGGFRFAVTLLAAFGTLSYGGYNYLQNTPVDPYWYWFGCRLTAVALIFVLGLLLYSLIKGYSMEVQDSKRPGELAKYIYIGVFSIFMMLLVYIFASFFLGYVIKTENSAIKSLLSIIIAIFAIIVGAFFFSPLLGQSNNSKSKEKERKFLVSKAFLITEVMFFCFLILLENLFPTVLYSPLQGHVTVDMEGIYYQNVSQIPVLIHVTGPNTGLSIYLVKKDSSHNLPPIENITLIPEQKPSYKAVSGKFLVGNTLDYGTYNVFINTTDLTAGYYELVCLRWGFNETYGNKGFYLLNSSE